MTRRGQGALLAVGAFCAAAFALLAWSFARYDLLVSIDRTIAAAALSIRHPIATDVMTVTTRMGEWAFVTVTAAAIVGWLLFIRRPRDAFVVVLIVAGGSVLSALMKTVVERMRPLAATAIGPLPVSWSFPSGHTMGAICLAGAVLVAARHMSRPWRAIAVGFAAMLPVAVGLSRVYLGVHWASDVVGAWLLGGAWIAAVVLVAGLGGPRKLERERRALANRRIEPDGAA